MLNEEFHCQRATVARFHGSSIPWVKNAVTEKGSHTKKNSPRLAFARATRLPTTSVATHSSATETSKLSATSGGSHFSQSELVLQTIHQTTSFTARLPDSVLDLLSTPKNTGSPRTHPCTCTLYPWCTLSSKSLGPRASTNLVVYKIDSTDRDATIVP